MKIVNSSKQISSLVRKAIVNHVGRYIYPSQIFENTENSFVGCWENISQKMYLAVKFHSNSWSICAAPFLIKGNGISFATVGPKHLVKYITNVIDYYEQIYGKIL
jgi:hypothetical protein